jgi:ligand-binding sensor domain-containing protein
MNAQRVFVTIGILLTLLSVPHSLSAQTGGDPRWRVLTAQDGLLSNDVWSLLVDDESIWLGTDSGIARYDGSWTNYPNVLGTDETAMQFSGLPSGTVTLLLKAANGDTIWAGTSSGAVSSWDGDSWNFEFSINPVLNAMLVDDESVLLGTDDGLLRYDLATQRVLSEPAPGRWGINALWDDGERLWAGTNNGLWRRVGGRWFRVRLPDGYRSATITTLWQDREHGRLWVGTNAGIHWFDPASEVWSDDPLPIYDERDERSPITAIVGDRDGNLWAGSTGAGARKFLDGGAVTIDVARSSGGGLTSPQVRDIAVDIHDTIWIATSVGVFRYREDAWFSEYRDPQGLDRRTNAVNDLLVDRWGRIWIATGAGIRLKEHSLVDFVDIGFTEADGPSPTDGVNVLEEDAQGGIWAGTFDGLFRYQLGEWTRPVSPDLLSSSVVTDFNADDFGIWIGTEAGLHYYHLSSRLLTDVPELAGRVVEVMARDSEQRLWVGTAQDGIWVRSIDDIWHHIRK